MTKKKLPVVNRELSWLAFNDRVLEEACDPEVPLIERIRFLAIFSSNLDEFFRVRVATVSRFAKMKNGAKLNKGFNPAKSLAEISAIVREQQHRFDAVYTEQILPELAAQHILLINERELSIVQQEMVQRFYFDHLQALLAPVMLDELKHFPELKDESIYLIVRMVASGTKNKPKHALIEVPVAEHSRFMILPDVEGNKAIILLDDVLRFCLPKLFSIFSVDVFEAYSIKLTRDAEMEADNGLTMSVLDNLSKNLKLRKHGAPMRLVYDEEMPDELLSYLIKRSSLKPSALVPAGRYHNFKDFMTFPNVGKPSLAYPKCEVLQLKKLPIGESILNHLAGGGHLLLSFPYQSFDYVIHFIREAAIDPKVTSIKITLYRLAQNSRIVNALINAAENGKTVGVLVELLARFDEENNIYWTRKLEDAGIKVLYGISHLKVHAKMCLLSRREGNRTQLYANLGTGNFNEKTAGVYADHSYFTADPAITKEVEALFHDLEKGILTAVYKNLLVAPTELRRRIIRLIDREIRHVKGGVPSEIILKLNSLTDDKTIAKLYEASEAGVTIKLIIRGICCLIPNLKSFSENIEVISIVDRYLEHARVFIFSNAGKEQIYLSSADLMYRNLDNRVEVAFPVLDTASKHIIRTMIDIQLADNTKARLMTDGDHNYIRRPLPKKKANRLRSQEAIYQFLKDHDI